MEDPDSNTVTAALVVIGEEILSGRTRDENIFHIAGYLDADIAHVLTVEEARRIASNIAKLPTLLGRGGGVPQ
jgi:molybdopterin-biosynthesis enzyme MoeA-like protein